MRPRPRLCAPNARSAKRAWSTPWPTASVRASGAGTPADRASAPQVRLTYFFLAALWAVVVVVVVGWPMVQGEGFQGSGCMFV
jgi:hypothetical protein